MYNWKGRSNKEREVLFIQRLLGRGTSTSDMTQYGEFIPVVGSSESDSKLLYYKDIVQSVEISSSLVDRPDISDTEVINFTLDDSGYKIESLTEEYGVSSDNTTYSGINDWRSTGVGLVLNSRDRYLWNKSTIRLSNGSEDSSYKIIASYIGTDTSGIFVTNLTEYYAISPYNTYAPEDSHGSEIGQWSPNSPVGIVIDNRYVWNYNIITFSDGSSQGGYHNAMIIGDYGNQLREVKFNDYTESDYEIIDGRIIAPEGWWNNRSHLGRTYEWDHIADITQIQINDVIIIKGIATIESDSGLYKCSVLINSKVSQITDSTTLGEYKIKAITLNYILEDTILDYDVILKVDPDFYYISQESGDIIYPSNGIIRAYFEVAENVKDLRVKKWSILNYLESPLPSTFLLCYYSNGNLYKDKEYTELISLEEGLKNTRDGYYYYDSLKDKYYTFEESGVIELESAPEVLNVMVKDYISLDDLRVTCDELTYVNEISGETITRTNLSVSITKTIGAPKLYLKCDDLSYQINYRYPVTSYQVRTIELINLGVADLKDSHLWNVSLISEDSDEFLEYDPDKSYEIGDYCKHSDRNYVCIASTTGVWDDSKWSILTSTILIDDHIDEESQKGYCNLSIPYNLNKEDIRFSLTYINPKLTLENSYNILESEIETENSDAIFNRLISPNFNGLYYRLGNVSRRLQANDTILMYYRSSSYEGLYYAGSVLEVTPIVDAYYNSTDLRFYSDPEYQSLIIPTLNGLYYDLVSSSTYICRDVDNYTYDPISEQDNIEYRVKFNLNGISSLIDGQGVYYFVEVFFDGKYVEAIPTYFGPATSPEDILPDGGSFIEGDSYFNTSFGEPYRYTLDKGQLTWISLSELGDAYTSKLMADSLYDAVKYPTEKTVTAYNGFFKNLAAINGFIENLMANYIEVRKVIFAGNRSLTNLRLYPKYDETKQYQINDRCSYRGFQWKCIQNTTGLFNENDWTIDSESDLIEVSDIEIQDDTEHIVALKDKHTDWWYGTGVKHQGHYTEAYPKKVYKYVGENVAYYRYSPNIIIARNHQIQDGDPSYKGFLLINKEDIHNDESSNLSKFDFNEDGGFILNTKDLLSGFYLNKSGEFLLGSTATLMGSILSDSLQTNNEITKDNSYKCSLKGTKAYYKFKDIYDVLLNYGLEIDPYGVKKDTEYYSTFSGTLLGFPIIDIVYNSSSHSEACFINIDEQPSYHTVSRGIYYFRYPGKLYYKIKCPYTYNILGSTSICHVYLYINNREKVHADSQSSYKEGSIDVKRNDRLEIIFGGATDYWAGYDESGDITISYASDYTGEGLNFVYELGSSINIIAELLDVYHHESSNNSIIISKSGTNIIEIQNTSVNFDSEGKGPDSEDYEGGRIWNIPSYSQPSSIPESNGKLIPPCTSFSSYNIKIITSDDLNFECNSYDITKQLLEVINISENEVILKSNTNSINLDTRKYYKYINVDITPNSKSRFVKTDTLLPLYQSWEINPSTNQRGVNIGSHESESEFNSIYVKNLHSIYTRTLLPLYLPGVTDNEYNTQILGTNLGDINNKFYKIYVEELHSQKTRTLLPLYLPNVPDTEYPNVRGTNLGDSDNYFNKSYINEIHSKDITTENIILTSEKTGSLLPLYSLDQQDPYYPYSTTPGTNLGTYDNSFNYIYTQKLFTLGGNDYVDTLTVDPNLELIPGKCYVKIKDKYQISSKYCQVGIIGIHSDTYAQLIGSQDEDQLRISVSGYALAYVDKKYDPGTPLTSSKNGNLTKMHWWSRILHPERLVGIYLREETEEFWKSKIKVNGRTWIKVK